MLPANKQVTSLFPTLTLIPHLSVLGTCDREVVKDSALAKISNINCPLNLRATRRCQQLPSFTISRHLFLLCLFVIHSTFRTSYGKWLCKDLWYLAVLIFFRWTRREWVLLELTNIQGPAFHMFHYLELLRDHSELVKIKAIRIQFKNEEDI